MAKKLTLKKIKLPKVLILLSVIFISCTALIVINYFTIKILSANRAYVNGESHYSKGQKDAARHLITYICNEDPLQWASFKKQLSVNQSDGHARVHLTNHSSIDTIKKDLRGGHNHEDDLDDMIWLFQNFNQISFFKKAIGEWEKGDALIDQFNALGNKIHTQVQNGHLDEISRKRFLSQINSISDKLTVNSRNFSGALGEGTREIKNYLIYTNIFFILIIICTVSLYYAMMVKRLMRSQHEIESKNADLLTANKELDRFVYSASHDLRSPISSLKGLVTILKTEEDPEEVKSYLAMMESVLNKQDQFIKDIIDYSRNKRTKDVLKQVSLAEIVKDAIEQLQYAENVKKITIEKELAVDKVFSDNLRLKIIVNNLLSNAIKYADFSKEKPFIAIKTYPAENNFIIQIEDNGIGINKQYLNRIFEMFFVTNKNKGTGLGLYIVKEAIENLNGNITVESKINVGTKFIVTIPLQNKP
ncbi:sensor histidine kinase [Flavobacterium wongokense]|uniref:sensor histidine kinase n=1 Tax=Flavobacterium wongokense TaxID=2910674 RepID=UPI001F184ED2|nr:HAMP domain-containing sensor histidine kinase [Flavobacterium sp. WG47]MCF6131095.1 HAMP domain-containing histidine kinase [Flavobacterium sp. WG47]